MSNLEIRVAALQFLGLRLCAALEFEELEKIQRSVLDEPTAHDAESLQMRAELLRLLDEAVARARCKSARRVKIRDGS